MAKKKAQHGGARKGAGRPPREGEPLVLIAAKVDASIVARVDEYAERHGLNRSQAIVVAIQRLPIPTKKTP